MSHAARIALALSTIAVPIWAGAAPTVVGPQAYTDFVGPNPYVASGWFLGVGATDITPAGSSLTVQAINVDPGEPKWNYAVPATPSPVVPRGYFALVPYSDQTGSWQIRATDSSGTSSVTTHKLNDVRKLPLVNFSASCWSTATGWGGLSRRKPTLAHTTSPRILPGDSPNATPRCSARLATLTSI